MEEKEINKQEEKWNTITHFIGILFALIAFPILLYNTYGVGNQFYASLIYGASFIFLFISSTIYHAVKTEKSKKLWRKIDHISIYFMISGTYVPFMFEYVQYSNAILFLSIMYSIVLIGTIFKIFFTGKFERLSLFIYVFLGWMVLFIAKSFFGNASILVSILVILGGLSYMGGIYFYSNDHKKYYHAIWHIFVLCGSILHFQAVYNI